MGRAYGTANQFAWTPAVAGTYSLQVWVRQVGVTASYQAWLGSGSVAITSPSSPLTSSSPVTSVTLAADRTFPVRAGTTVTWTSTANASDAEYSFWLYNGVSWSNLQPYGPPNAFTWMPSTAGTYALQVWTRHVGSTASYEAWAGSGSITVTP
jgi:hypothetical protein